MVTIKKKTVKRVIYIILGLLILYGGIKFFTGSSYPDIDTPKPVFGDPNSPVKIVEFSDLQCPACQAAHPTVKQIMDEFGDQISFQYFHFPLRAIHPYAQKAAEGAECANDQGMYWEYIDAAFGLSPQLQNRNLRGIAEQLGLNVEDFTACLNSGAKRKVVEGDLRLGSVKNVQGTPTFFINDKRVQNWNYASFKAVIEQELAATGVTN